ncbi:MAG: hypothetical protein RIQ81_323 [Pseudomonadota bacterium]|jgi:hypothetical protein
MISFSVLRFAQKARKNIFAIAAASIFLSAGCTQEMQNKVSRSIQNWTGTDGVLDVISDGKVMYRFIKIDKISTAQATGDRETARPYRFGYGVLDVNQNFTQDQNERKIYFEFSDFSTSYVFYENPGAIK